MTLLPTPKASDGPNGGPGMRNGRGQADALPGVVALLPTPTSQAAKHGPLAPSELTDARPQDRSNLWINPDGDAAEAGPDQALPDLRGRSDAQRPSQPDDAVRVLPSASALAGGPTEADGGRAPGMGDISGAWGPYAAAVLRWEMVTGRVAPPPTEPSNDGRPRLSARAVEFMMGLPAGHVTDPAIGLTRAQQLKSLGNGVVPQHAAMALRMLIETGPTP